METAFEANIYTQMSHIYLDELRAVRFFVKISKQINLRSLGSCCIKESKNPIWGKDSSIPLIHHVPSDPRSIRDFPKEKHRKKFSS